MYLNEIRPIVNFAKIVDQVVEYFSETFEEGNISHR